MTNVLLITVDSLRADHVGTYGYERNTTPHIDALADKARVYKKAFSHACSTRPSFPSILTSSYPLMYGGYQRLSESRTLISEVFDDVGYRTAGLHSNAYLNPEFGYGRGFDYLFDSMTDTSMIAKLRQWVKTNLDNSGLPYRLLFGLYQLVESGTGTDIGSAYVDADEMTDRAINWLKNGNRNNEFLWVHYMDVHHPYLPPDEHQKEFRANLISDRQSMQLRRKMLEAPEDITGQERQQIIDLYDSEIRFVDDEIGRLLNTISDQWDDYVVAFTADHGEEFGEHGKYSHHDTFYDEVTHVPLIVYDDQNQGDANEIVGLLDLAPTLIDLAGLDQPENFHGYSLQQIEEGKWPRTAVFGNWEPTGKGHDKRRFAYRDQRWKYIQRENTEELYYIPNDPSEQNNIAENRSEKIERFRKTISDHVEDIDSTYEDLGDVTMDENVKERLRDLGYKE